MKTVRTIVYLSLLAVLSCHNKPTTFDIQGTTDNPEAKEAYLIAFGAGAQGIDTLAKGAVAEGKFHLSGSVTEPIIATLMVGNSYAEMVLENDNFTAVLKETGESDILGGTIHAVVNGYKQREDFKDALAKMKLIQGQRRADAAIDEKSEAELQASFEKINTIANDYQDSILQHSDNTWIKAFTLGQVQNWEKYDLKKRTALLADYRKELGDRKYLDELESNFKKMHEEELARERVANGKPYQEVVATTKEGQEMKLSEIVSNNKYTLLEFWASWCKPCRAEIPNLKTAYSKYHPKGFEIYAISLDENEEQWWNAMKEENTPWLNLVDLRNFGSPAANDYAVTAIPASFLIANDGTIVASADEIRGDGLAKILEKLIK